MRRFQIYKLVIIDVWKIEKINSINILKINSKVKNIKLFHNLKYNYCFNLISKIFLNYLRENCFDVSSSVCCLVLSKYFPSVLYWTKKFWTGSSVNKRRKPLLSFSNFIDLVFVKSASWSSFSLSNNKRKMKFQVGQEIKKKHPLPSCVSPKVSWLKQILTLWPVIHLFKNFFHYLTDINELNLPKTCQMEFPDPDDLLNFKLIISPDEVWKWKSGGQPISPS